MSGHADFSDIFNQWELWDIFGKIQAVLRKDFFH